MTLEELIDREALRDVLTRYCRAADRHDKELMQSTYWPDAEDDHGPMFKGKASAFIDMAMASSRFEQTQHVLGQSTFRFEEHRARVETYATAYHRLRRAGDACEDVVVGARLFDLFEKRGDEWRVLNRRLVMDWFRSLGPSVDWDEGVFGGRWTMGSKDGADPSYAFFA